MKGERIREREKVETEREREEQEDDLCRMQTRREAIFPSLSLMALLPSKNERGQREGERERKRGKERGTGEEKETRDRSNKKY